ncbi:cell wall-binding repeat-containing protein [Clostridium thailandense]|uniref:cell wall-binding repeat-containing protein n=1 Tax=Clostridium thailandense TaxID=2794346 RepID=UPI003989F5DE
MLNRKNCFILLCSLLFSFLFMQSKVFASSTIRLAGNDRYETSVKTSQDSWNQSDYVVLVSGENFPDGLSAAPLARKYDAPILLTQKEKLNDVVLNEIQRLQTKNVFIVGGTGVISKNIEDTLNSLKISCTRLQGQDRYETSIKVAELIGTKNGAFISSGENFPDALSASSIAASKQMPILFSASNSLPSSVKDYIDANNINNFYVTGGTGVISDAALSGLNNVKRLSGIDRYSTNLSIINEFSKDINFSNVYFASGENFPDALSASAAAAKNSSPILLANGAYTRAKSIIDANSQAISTIKILGGTSIIPDSLLQKIFEPSKAVLGYSTHYYDGDNSSYNSIVNNSSLLDEIATDTYYIDGYGNMNGTAPSDQINYANKNNISTLAMISNNFDGNVSKTLLESSVNRKNLINNIVSALKTNNYKGVNIDIEGAYYYDRDYFTTFMSELYNTLHPQGFEVTVAVPSKTVDSTSDNWTGSYDYAAISKYADKIVIMTYDEHWAGGSPGPIASINWVKSVVNYTLSVIPKEKIMLGIASYGYDWPSNGQKAEAYSMRELYNLVSQYNASIKWSDSAKSPYFNYTDNSGVYHTVWFENSTSIGYKLDIVNDYNLPGVAIWRLGLENNDFWTTIALKLNK